MSTSFQTASVIKSGFETALDSVVTADRNRVLIALVILAPVSALIGFITPHLLGIPALFWASIVAHHLWLRYRVTTGRYGYGRHELDDLFSHWLAEPDHRPI